MNPFQKQLVAGDGQLFMDKPDLMGKVWDRDFYYGSPPAPQKVSVEEFEQGREVATMSEYEALMSKRPEPKSQPAEDRQTYPTNRDVLKRQAEGRTVHKPPENVDVIYVDAESGDGKIRAAIDAANTGKQTVIVIRADNFDSISADLEKLFEEKRKKLYETPLTEFVQERMNLPPEKP
jgi:hypothetical protein